MVRWIVLAAALVVLLALPLYVEEFWLRTGFAVFTAMVGAIGLNLLVGNTGQLSLAHAFFLAVGAVSYVFVSGESGGIGLADLDGLGWPPVLGMIVGVLMAGLAGLLFSPIAARLRGIYLGVASLGLVFIGQHVLNSWTSVTGGFNGRSAPEFSLFGFTFGNTDPQLFVIGVPFREAERLWYLGLVLALAAYVFAKNLLRSRPGRALQTLRDSEVAASVMGVNVQRYKGRVFLVSSMYAGLAGVMYALSIGSIAPESFGLELSILYLAMIVLGGLGSVGGACLGALFVTAMPLLFQRYADVLPFVGGAGEGGLAPGEAARYLFGLAIILVIMFEPAGLAGFAHRFRRKSRDPGGGPPTERSPAATSSSTTSDPSDRPAQGSTS
jgi:branched-chain amino acid transport system permease protein